MLLIVVGIEVVGGGGSRSRPCHHGGGCRRRRESHCKSPLSGGLEVLLKEGVSDGGGWEMEASGLQNLYSAPSTSLHAFSAEVAQLDPPHSHGHAIYLRLLA